MDPQISALQLGDELLAQLPFTPNAQQVQAAAALARFCTGTVSATAATAAAADRVFVLNGYAGTGKTSLTGALVRVLLAHRVPVVLLAPTGRAAKVFAASAAYPAYTIHRRIYSHALEGTLSYSAPAPRENTLHDAVFIVDEASMIATDAADADSNVLTDLIHFVYSGPGCRMILMGDTAQLPPVGQADSPAMNPDVLRAYGLKVTRLTLTDVARQGPGSAILLNATAVRRALGALKGGPIIKLLADGHDVCTVGGDELPELLDSLYRLCGEEETIVITRSNRSATDYNRGIRTSVLYREEELCAGDLLIAAKNNYFWSKGVKGLDFIANGEILQVTRVCGTEHRYGLRFADVSLHPVDRPALEFDAKIVLNALGGTAAALSRDDFMALYRGVYEARGELPPEADHLTRSRYMRSSPYWNALQLKHAYAVTCHKAQGGQWTNVLIDLSYIPPEQLDGEFYRWLYTAITRARTRLYLINPPDELIR